MPKQLNVIFLLLLIIVLEETEAFWLPSIYTTKTIEKVHLISRHLLTTNMVDADHNKGTPILPEKLVFVEDGDEILQSKRQAAFARFQRVVESLADIDDDNQLSLIWNSDREVNHAGVVPINSLLFQASTLDESSMKITTTLVVVVVPSSEKVDIRKLQMHLEEDNHDERIPNSKVKCFLVPADQVEELCGFPPLSVPPLGHAPHSLRILVEETLYHAEGAAILQGGGGHPKIGCLIAANTLLKIEGTELADLTKNTAGSDANSESDLTTMPQEHQLQPTPSLSKPFFQVAPPSTEEAYQVVTQSDQPNPLAPEPITMVGRISGLRRMARKLAFVDMAPPGYVGTGTKLDAFELPWRSAVDGEDMSVQLIAGKTFCKHKGDQDGAEALKRLRVGQLILVEGKTNVGNRESLRHWCDKRSFDVVVFNYRILEEAPERQHTPSPFANGRANTKQQQQQGQLQPSAASLSTRHSSNPANCLKLSDVFTDSATIKIVDTKEDIADFHQRLETLSLGINGDKAPLLVGIDCEWRPNFLVESSDEAQPVLLLQISLQKINTVYLWDLQALLRPRLEPSDIPNATEDVASKALAKLFASPQFLKIGFQLLHDLKMLAGSYPHILAFRSLEAVLEVSAFTKLAMQIEKVQNSKQYTSSLARLTKHLSDKPMNKDQQISDWSCRPLSSAQREYAALDAAVTPFLFEKVLELGKARWVRELQIGRTDDDTALAESIISIHFDFAVDENIIREAKARKIVSNHWLVTQWWVSGREPPSPLCVATTTDSATT